MQSQTNTEQYLLTALARGEREATGLIYHQNYPMINNWLIKNGGSAIDSPDLFQEAIIVLFGKVQEKDFRLTCSIGTYLLAVSKHLWYKKLQRQSRDPVLLPHNTEIDEVEGAGYEDDISVHKEREVHYEQLESVLDMIGEPCRSLLKAYYHHDKSMQEIAADFGYTNPENAKNQKYKCLARLRKLFYSMQAK